MTSHKRGNTEYPYIQEHRTRYKLGGKRCSKMSSRILENEISLSNTEHVPQYPNTMSHIFNFTISFHGVTTTSHENKV